VHVLKGLDLNLLRVLEAVLEHGTVTLAAERLGLSQSATSHALERLRRALDDPLLVREGRKFVPTTRAENLRGPLREALNLLDVALSPPQPFDPQTEKRTFRIATSDYAEFLLIPRLVERLSREAPGIDIAVVPLSAAEDLQSADVDAAIGLSQLFQRASGVRKRALFSETFSCLLRPNHPALERPWTVKNFAKLRHAMIAPTGNPGGIVDDALAKLGSERRVVASVPHFLIAPFLIPNTDLVVTLPSRVARAFASSLGLVVVEPPLKLPGFQMHLVWREQMHRDQAQVWFRNELRHVAAEVETVEEAPAPPQGTRDERRDERKDERRDERKKASP
jgi:DNA-binding transcriptional LysR family regulator